MPEYLATLVPDSAHFDCSFAQVELRALAAVSDVARTMRDLFAPFLDLLLVPYLVLFASELPFPVVLSRHRHKPGCPGW